VVVVVAPDANNKRPRVQTDTNYRRTAWRTLQCFVGYSIKTLATVMYSTGSVSLVTTFHTSFKILRR